MEMGIYTGEQGLEHVMAKLRAFKADNGWLPKTSDKVRSGIEDAILRGEWTSFGIMSWNDLLRKTFGEVNQVMGIYTGEQGLKRAMAELKAFRDENGRLPTNSDKIRGGIKAAIRRRAWASFGVIKWNDLLRKTFGEVNNENGIYFGELGLGRAIAELRAFKDFHGRLPTSSDKIGEAIQAVIIRGEWDSFGIKRWNDLLRKTFGEVNAEKEIYTGERGLERAMAELRAFKDQHSRLPTNNDKAVGGIRGAVKRGGWASFGVRKWNDLLRKVFGEVNNDWGIYIGERGLKQAITELQAFKTEHGKLPTVKDKEMSGIPRAIGRKEWVSFGIMRWNDLLRKVFGEVNNEMEIYTGERGLERAIAELRAFKTKHRRLPTVRDKEMWGILGAIGRKEWVSFGIMRWSDLRIRTFGAVGINGKYQLRKKEKYQLLLSAYC